MQFGYFSEKRADIFFLLEVVHCIIISDIPSGEADISHKLHESRGFEVLINIHLQNGWQKTFFAIFDNFCL